MQDKELFDLFVAKKNDFDLCNRIEEMIKERIEDALGKENVEFYDVLRKLIDSINNAGWESRHSEQIRIINKKMREISDKYEGYLP